MTSQTLRTGMGSWVLYPQNFMDIPLRNNSFCALEAEGVQEHVIITHQEFGRRTTLRVPPKLGWNWSPVELGIL